jgi:hypothetical protein
VFHHGRGFLQVTSWIGSVIVLLVYMRVQQRRA